MLTWRAHELDGIGDDPEIGSAAQELLHELEERAADVVRPLDLHAALGLLTLGDGLLL